MSRHSLLRPRRWWLCIFVLCLLLASGQPLPVEAFALTSDGLLPAFLPSVNSSINSLPNSPLQIALDQSVRQSVLASGWNVVALASTLNLEDATGLAARQSGNGHWHVDALVAGTGDAPPEPLTLDGTLAFELRAQPRVYALGSTSLTLKGVLNADKTELAIDLAGSGTNDGDTQTQSITGSLRAARNGQTHTISIHTTIESRLAAYNLPRITLRSVVNRDGIPWQSEQTLTIREYGKGERELWLHAVESPAGAPARTADAHGFQRAVTAPVEQYLDQLDVQVADAHFVLQQPASLLTDLAGLPQYDVVLVDQADQAVHVSTAPVSIQPNTPAPATALGRVNGTLGPLPALGTAGGALMPLSNPCRPRWAFAVMGGSAPFLLDVIARYQWQQVWQLGAQPAPSANELADGAFVLGTASFASLLSVLSKADTSTLCADGNLIAPGNRVEDAAPLQITRITGGLLSPSALPTDLPDVVTGTAGYALFTYRDRPGAFAAATPPSGATVIGGWLLDQAHSFRGEPAHTMAARDGAQQHYFIHAGTPLSVTLADEIIQYVYLDPAAPPAEIYLQFYTRDGNGEHRVFWGEDRAQTGGAAGTPSLFPLGALPPRGAWVRLRVPVAMLGLGGEPISGILYGAYNGQTFWGPTVTAERDTDSAPDQLALDESPMPGGLAPGAQVAFSLSQPLTLTATIVDAQGAQVRTLLKDVPRTAGYQAVTWDGRDDAGAAAPDKPYRVRFSSGDAVLSDDAILQSPLTARIASPTAWSLAGGPSIPILGEALGSQFSRYVLEYGEGTNPARWLTLAESNQAATLPTQSILAHSLSGNLANWNTSALNGLYTLRLRVIANDGRQIVDTLSLVLGQAASAIEGGIVSAADAKARLTVPPFAVYDPPVLLALTPLSLSNPNGDWRSSLPAGMNVASDLYEVDTTSLTFQRAATLELPYPSGTPATKLGVLLGDGTPNGWRFIGGSADAQQSVVRVALSELPDSRAYVAVFAADQFGTAQSPTAASAPLVIDPRGAAPFVFSSTLPIAFYNDFESSGPQASATSMEWEPLDARGTQLARVRGPAAFYAGDGNALRVTRLAGGVRLVRARASPFDAAKYPLLAFDYRVPPESAPNLLVHSNGVWWQLLMGSDRTRTALQPRVPSRAFESLSAPSLVRDNQWHRYQLDLLAMLRAAQPAAASFQVDGIAFGQIASDGERQAVPVDDGAVGSTYSLDNFAALAPVSATSFTLALGAPGATFNGYSYRLDQANDTITQPAVQSASNRISVTLPADAADGLWYVHTRGRDSNGQWSVPGHFPIFVDREPPQVGAAHPAANAAGSPDLISVSISDRSALDLASLQLQLNGTKVGTAQGISFDPIAQSLRIQLALLQPPLSIPNGKAVDIAVNALADAAGNALAAPVRWHFVADTLAVSGDNFRQLTIDGGESPALAPDGSQIAFVSRRTGSQKIWLMRTDDDSERAQPAKPLTIGSASESDPAWSPDGRFLAYVSEAGGRPQLWIAGIMRPDRALRQPQDAIIPKDAVDGARALDTGDGIVASPVWSPDGRSLVFIRDGNLAQINVDGSAMRALTTLSAHPLRSVRWQPGGSQLLLDVASAGKRLALYDLTSGEVCLLSPSGAHSAEWMNARTIVYAAPTAVGLDALWQMTIDDVPPMLLDGSGLPDIADAQPAVSRDGSALAMVSLRDGSRNIWIRANEQLPTFEITPLFTTMGDGTAQGTPVVTTSVVIPSASAAITSPVVIPVRIAYAFTADSVVTVQVMTNDAPLTLVNRETQAAGAQRVIWNGSGADGRPLPPGDYAVRLAVQTDFALAERYGTARLFDAATLGRLQVQVNQWADTRLADTRDLQVTVYPRGDRTQPIAESSGDASPLFILPAGQYEIWVTAHGIRRTVSAVQVETGKTAAQAIDLQFGTLQMALLNAPDSPVANAASIQIVSSDDPDRTPLAVQQSGQAEFAMPPGHYDVVAVYQDVTQRLLDVDVKAAQTTRQEINFGSGLIAFTVRAFAGQPAETGGRLVVEAFRAGERDQPVAADTNNPTQLRVPGGVFDIRIRYGADALHPIAGGTVERWIEGIAVQPEQTIAQDFDMRLGEVRLAVQESDGKPAEAARLAFHLYYIADPNNAAAAALFSNAATFQLPAGEYAVVVDYGDTELRHEGRVTTLTVVPGQSRPLVINLKLARIHVLVVDKTGNPVDDPPLRADAYPAGSRIASFAATFGANPLILSVRSDTPYDLVLGLGEQQLVLQAQSVKEGAVLEIKVNAEEFK